MLSEITLLSAMIDAENIDHIVHILRRPIYENVREPDDDQFARSSNKTMRPQARKIQQTVRRSPDACDDAACRFGIALVDIAVNISCRCARRL